MVAFNTSILNYELVQVFVATWEYGKAAAKRLLPFSSCHSKHEKLGIIRNLVKESVQKSCSHSIGSSLLYLTERFGVAGYPQELILRQVVYLLYPKKSVQKCTGCLKRVAFRYFHRVSHNIKALANTFNVDTAFSTDYRLNRLTSFASTVSGCV